MMLSEFFSRGSMGPLSGLGTVKKDGLNQVPLITRHTTIPILNA